VFVISPEFAGAIGRPAEALLERVEDGEVVPPVVDDLGERRDFGWHQVVKADRPRAGGCVEQAGLLFARERSNVPDSRGVIE
jgi:hypothetical protein